MTDQARAARAAYQKVYNAQPFIPITTEQRSRAGTTTTRLQRAGGHDGYDGNKGKKRRAGSLGSSSPALRFIACIAGVLLLVAGARHALGGGQAGGELAAAAPARDTTQRERNNGGGGGATAEELELSRIGREGAATLRMWHGEGGGGDAGAQTAGRTALRGGGGGGGGAGGGGAGGALSRGPLPGSPEARDAAAAALAAAETNGMFTRTFAKSPLGSFGLRAAVAGAAGEGEGEGEGSVVSVLAAGEEGRLEQEPVGAADDAAGARLVRDGDRLVGVNGENVLKFRVAALARELRAASLPITLTFAGAAAGAHALAAALHAAERARHARADASVSAAGTFRVRFSAKPLGVALGTAAGGKSGTEVRAVARRTPPVRVGDLVVAVNGHHVASWTARKLVASLAELAPPLIVLFARPHIARIDLAEAALTEARGGDRAAGARSRGAGTYTYTVRAAPIGIAFKDAFKDGGEGGPKAGAVVEHVTRGFTDIVPGDLLAAVNGLSVASWSARQVADHMAKLTPPLQLLFATPDIARAELAIAIRDARRQRRGDGDGGSGGSGEGSVRGEKNGATDTGGAGSDKVEGDDAVFV